MPGFGKQLGMGADLFDLPLIHDHDLVGGKNCRKAMGDGDDCAALGKTLERELNLFSDSESRAEVASSSKRIGAFFNKARAIANRCCCPPESIMPLSPTTVS